MKSSAEHRVREIHNDPFRAKIEIQSESIRVSLESTDLERQNLFACVCAASDEMLRQIRALSAVWGTFAEEQGGTIDICFNRKTKNCPPNCAEVLVAFVEALLKNLDVAATMSRIKSGDHCGASSDD